MSRLNNLLVKVSGGLLAVVWLSGSPLAQEKTIHRCTQSDGSVAFQELPCPEQPQAAEEEQQEPDNPVPVEPADDFFSYENPFDEAPAESRELPSQDRVACEKTTRRAIDVIDAKLNESKSEDDRDTYLAELLDLTAQLRACKQL